MKLKLGGGHGGNRGNLIEIEVTSKINIYQSIVTSGTSVTSIIPRACRGKKCNIHVFLSCLPTLCKLEVTEVTQVTWSLLILFFRLPLQRKVTSKLPLLSGRRPLYE